MQTVGQFLKAKRKYLGFSVRVLGKKADVSFTYISELERGTKKPTLDVLSRLLKALNVSWLEFTSATGYAEPLEPRTEKMLQVFSQLTPEQQAEVLRELEEAKPLKPGKAKKAR